MSDHSEFLKRFLKHEGDLKAYIWSMVRDPGSREDVFQEVALALMEQFHRFDSSRSFGAWARGIATKKVLQRRHDDRRFNSAGAKAMIMGINGAFERTSTTSSDVSEALEFCLDKLPKNGRVLLAWRYESDLKANEIASKLGRTTAAVHQALCRLRVRLQDCVNQRLQLAGNDRE